jgi:hypothetical protein
MMMNSSCKTFEKFVPRGMASTFAFLMVSTTYHGGPASCFVCPRLGAVMGRQWFQNGSPLTLINARGVPLADDQNEQALPDIRNGRYGTSAVQATPANFQSNPTVPRKAAPVI